MFSGIYKMLLTHSKLSMSKEILATKVLPFLLPLCIEQNLSMSQYETISTLVIDMINRVINEHREALRQLDAVRRETQQFDHALSQVISSTFIQNNSLNDINLTPEVSSSNVNTKSVNIENGLSIEDKFRFQQFFRNIYSFYCAFIKMYSCKIKYTDNYFSRLIQQQEAHQRLQSQSMLTPKTVSQPTKSQPKDLTATLLKNNLDELNLSISRTAVSQSDYTAKNVANLSCNKNNNVNQMQPQFLTSTLNSQTMSSRPMNWNSNGLNTSMNWNAQQSMLMWSSITPQSNVNFTTQSEIRPNLNFPGTLQPGTLQPFILPTNTSTNSNKPDINTQDIMDLLS